MKRSAFHLALLCLVLTHATGGALAAHHALAHDHDHDHGHHQEQEHTDASTACAVCHALTRAIDLPPALDAPTFERLVIGVATPVDDAAPTLQPTSPAQPRAPPAG